MGYQLTYSTTEKEDSQLNFKEKAAKLTGTIFNLKGSNRANEVQQLIYDALIEAYKNGYEAQRDA